MRLNADSRDQLAARYVLGTLTGKARQRMEKIMMLDWRVREAVWQWETQLGPLLLLPPPVSAPARVLDRIERRLFGNDLAPARTPNNWAGLLAAFSVLALALTLWLSRPPSPASSASFAAMAVQEQGVQWRFAASAGFSELNVRAILADAAESDKDYELWIVPQAGAPMSLGVVRAGTGEQRVQLSASQQQALAVSRLLAVSLEPAGGSPTGQPTGPVLYTATFVSI